MGLRIRLARAGAKKRPYYRIVIADVRSPRDGRFIERVGSYNPLLRKDDPDRVTLNEERIRHWLGHGAVPTDRVARFLGSANIVAMPAQGNNPNKAKPKKKAQERAAATEEAKKAAAEAAEKPPAAAVAPEAPAEETAPEAPTESAPSKEASVEEPTDEPAATEEPTQAPIEEAPAEETVGESSAEPTSSEAKATEPPAGGEEKKEE